MWLPLLCCANKGPLAAWLQVSQSQLDSGLWGIVLLRTVLCTHHTMQSACCSAAVALQVLRLIDEPTSAALAVYGLDRPHKPLSGSKSSAALTGLEQSQAATQASSVRRL